MDDPREKVWQDTWSSDVMNRSEEERMSPPPMTRAQVEKMRNDYDAGQLNVDALSEEESTQFIDMMGLLDRAEAFEKMGAGTSVPPEPQNVPQSDTGASRGLSAYHVDELPFDRKPLTRPVASEKEDLYRASLFESWLSGQDLIETTATISEESREKSPEEMVRTRANTISEQDREDTLDTLNRLDLSQTPEQIEDEIAAVEEMLRIAEEEGKTIPDFTLYSVLGGGEVTDEVAKRLAVNGKVREMVQKIYDDMGWTDWTREAVGWFLPGKQIKDNIDYTGSAFSAQEFANNLVQNFRALSPEEQEEALPVIKEDLLADLPDLRAAQVLEALTSPTGQEDITDFHILWAAWDAAEISYMAGSLLNNSFKVMSKYRIIKQIQKDLGKTSISADSLSTAAISQSDEAVRAIGLDRPSLVNSIVGLKAEGLEGQRVERVATETLKRLEDYENKVANFTESVADGSSRLTEGFLSPKDRAKVEAKKFQDLKDKKGIEEVEIVSRTDTSVTMEYEAYDESGTYLGRQTYVAPIGLEDIDPLQLNVSGLIGQALKSPLSWLKGEGRDLVKSAERIDSQKAKMSNDLRNLFAEAMSPVLGKRNLGILTRSGRKSVDKLNTVLLQGDQDGAVYTVKELRAPPFNLNESEIEAYYNVRNLTDSLLDVRNLTKRKEYEIKGYKSVLVSDESLIAKPFAEATAALGSVRDTGAKMYYNASEGKALSLDTLNMAKAYEHGWVLARLPEYEDVGGVGNKVKFVLVRGESVGALPREVIPRRVGYIPKINLDGAYFVKIREGQVIDGEKVTATSSRASIRTDRAFSNRDEAEAYVLRKTEERLAAGKTSDDILYEALSDRQLEKERALSFAGQDAGLGGSTGGLFTGARSEDDILFGLEGVKGDRLDAFTALSRNLASVSKYVPTNEWRLALEAKAVETANMLMGKGDKVFRSFEQLRLVDEGTANGKVISGLYKQVNDWKGIPTRSEVVFQEAVQDIVDSSIGTKLRKLTKGKSDRVMLDLKSKDPVAAMRAAAFHGLLGWFNPIQLWVQAQGALISASINMFDPAMLTRNLADQMFLRMVQDVDFTPEMARHIAKSLKADEKELIELFTAYRRSGLQDAVLVNADYAAAMKGHGVTMEALSRASENGLMFYREGEGFNRRMSFSTAYNEWKAKNKGAELTDEALATIVDRANDFMLNMGRANRAAWQRGVMGLPTQFMQVTAKTVESLIGMNGNFDWKDRSKIFAGQISMYGAAGIPLGNIGSTIAAGWLGYDTQEEIQKKMSPEVRKTLNEGFLGYMMMAITGVDMDVGNRSSLLEGTEQVLNDMFFSDSTVLETLSGAFGAVGGGFWAGLSGQYVPLSMNRITEGEVNWLTGLSAPVVSSIATFRNIEKAYFMSEYHKIVDKNYNAVVAREFSLGEILATAAGAQLTDVQEVYSAEKMVEVRKKTANKIADTIIKQYYMAAIYSKDGQLTPDKIDQIYQDSAKLIQTLPTPRLRQIAQERIRNKLTDMSSREGKAWKEFMLIHADGYVNTMMDYQRLLTGDLSQLKGGFGGALIQDERFQGQEVAE